MNPDRIAVFLPTLEGGGTEATMLALAGGLAERGHLVDLVLKKKQGEFSQSIPSGVRVVDFAVPSMRHTLPLLVKYIQRERPQAVVSALELPNFTSILSRLISANKPKVIISIRGLLSKQRPIYSRRVDQLLERVLYPLADEIVCVSRACAVDATRHAHLPEERVTVIYNPVIDSVLVEKMKQPLTYSWLPSGPAPMILAIGRLEPVKDHQTLLRAFRRLRAERQAKLVILGEGSLKGALLAQAKDLNMDDDIILPGFVENPFNIMAAAEMLVLSSLREALPGVIIQAMACGCPVVSTTCGGAEEVLADGKYGQLVAVGDDTGMAEAMLRVMAGDRRPAPRAWLAQFHKDTVLDQYQALLRF